MDLEQKQLEILLAKNAYLKKTLELAQRDRDFERDLKKPVTTAPLTIEECERLKEGLDAIKAKKITDEYSREQTPEQASNNDSDSAPECGPLEKGKGVSKRK